jgi:type I restriction enzyme, S subunit
LITGTLVKDQYISLPPLDEQTAIVHHIETETTKVNDKINLIKQEIELLKEYRQALIFEAVTGKIRVH